MNRKTLITIHMYLSAFFAPMVLLVSISGGLYLVGIKGEISSESVLSIERAALDTGSDTLKADVQALLAEAGVTDFDFEYVKVKGDTLYTRPTSTEHYIIKQSGGSIELTHALPSLQKRLIELHMGHGPGAFKTFQQLFALGLLLVILSGLWLGLSALHLRTSTLATTAAGAVVFLALLF